MSYPSSFSYQSHLMSHEDNPSHAMHILEFSELGRRLAYEVIQEVVPQMVEDTCLRIIKDYLNSSLNGSLQYDVHSLASVSIADFNKMFKSEQFSRFISDAVTDEIRKRIDEINLNIKL